VKAVILFLFAVLVCGYSSAAGFDCRAAGTLAEKLICSDAALSKMDEQLVSDYRKMLASLDAVNKKKLMGEQRAWLKNSRGLCDDLACLRRSYETRIRMIHECNGVCVNASELYALDGEDHNLLTLRDSNERNTSFNKDLLAHHFGTVFGCETLIDVAVGTAHGNDSFGGLCKLKGQTGFVMVCNDEMVGHFRIAKATSATTRNELANFTIRNCFGG
jgi:uncharacterized protein